MKYPLNHLSKNIESMLLAALSLTLSVSALLFISREIKTLSSLALTKEADPFYLAFFIISVLIIGTVLFFNINSINWKLTIKKLLLAFLPSEIILSYGLSNSTHFHYIFYIATGLYIIIAGFYLISIRSFSWKEKPKNSISALGRWAKLQGKMAWVIIFVVMMTNLSLGTYNLAKFGAVDEPLWTFDRIPNYWKNIGERDWKGTRISDKPGITVAIISGAGLLSEAPKAYKSAYGRGLIETDANRYDFEKLNFAFRFPLFLFTVLMLPFFYFLVERLLGKKIALFSYISIGLSPLLIGMASIINPDAILWTFGPLSLLSFLVYQKRRNSFYLHLSAIFLGLALLTKYVANILSVFFLGLLFVEYVFHKANYNKITVTKYIKESLTDYLILFFIALVTFYALFPAVWIKPSKLLEGTLLSQAFESTWPIFAGFFVLLLIDTVSLRGRIFSFILNTFSKYSRILLVSISTLFLLCIALTLANTYLGMPWYDFEAIISAPKSAYSTGGYDGLFFANFFPLSFSIVPLSFIFLIFATIVSIFKKNLSNRLISTIFSLTLFILLYYTATTVNKVAAMNRYQIMVFPAALILGGIGMGIFYSKFFENKKVLRKFVLPFVLVLSMATAYFARPFFISYDSPLLPNNYYTDLKDMGTGSYEAAQFINSLPDAENLQVWTDKKGACPFLKAKCYTGFTYPKLRAADLDYAIVSAGRESRTKKMVTPATIKKDLLRFDTLYDRTDEDVVYKLEINDRPENFVKVIRLDQEFFDLYKNQ